MVFGIVFLLFVSLVVGHLELLKRDEYCEFLNFEVCRIRDKIRYFSCELPYSDLNDDNDDYIYEDHSVSEQKFIRYMYQCMCKLDHDFFLIWSECNRQCGFDGSGVGVTPEAIQSTVCSIALGATESSYIEDYVSSMDAEISRAQTDTEGSYHISDWGAYNDIYNSTDYSSQVSSILKSISDSKNKSESTKSSTATTTKGSSSNIAVTVGCGSLFSLALLALL